MSSSRIQRFHCSHCNTRYNSKDRTSYDTCKNEKCATTSPSSAKERVKVCKECSDKCSGMSNGPSTLNHHQIVPKVEILTQPYVDVIKAELQKELHRLKTKYNPSAKIIVIINNVPKEVYHAIFDSFLKGKEVYVRKKKDGNIYHGFCFDVDTLEPIFGHKYWQVPVYAEDFDDEEDDEEWYGPPQKEEKIEMDDSEKTLSGYYGVHLCLSVDFIEDNFVGQLKLSGVGELRNIHGNLQ